jgi:hypothetical protein
MRVRAVAHLQPVSILDIVCDMAGKIHNERLLIWTITTCQMVCQSRSQFDANGALEDDKVKQLEYKWHIYITYDAHDCFYNIHHRNYSYYVDYCNTYYLSYSYLNGLDHPWCVIVYHKLGLAVRPDSNKSVDSSSRPIDSSNCSVEKALEIKVLCCFCIILFICIISIIFQVTAVLWTLDPC